MYDGGDRRHGTVEHGIFATLTKAPRMCETKFHKLLTKRRNDKDKLIDSNNDAVTFTLCLSENTKRIKLWCVFFGTVGQFVQYLNTVC
jgi:hypothetical protein